MRNLLVLGGLLSFAIAAFHVLLAFSADLSRQFGAPDWVMQWQQARDLRIYAVALGMAVLFALGGVYAWSGAGIVKRLPLLRVILLVIGVAYAWRGLALFPEVLVALRLVKGWAPPQELASSLIALVTGLCYLAGPIGVLAGAKNWYGKNG